MTPVLIKLFLGVYLTLAVYEDNHGSRIRRVLQLIANLVISHLSTVLPFFFATSASFLLWQPERCSWYWLLCGRLDDIDPCLRAITASITSINIVSSCYFKPPSAIMAARPKRIHPRTVLNGPRKDQIQLEQFNPLPAASQTRIDTINNTAKGAATSDAFGTLPVPFKSDTQSRAETSFFNKDKFGEINFVFVPCGNVGQ